MSVNLRATVAVVVLATIPAVTLAGDRHDAEATLFQSLEWAMVRTVQSIDPGVLSALRSRFGKDLRLSNPGEPFEATDIVSGKPSRRLLLAGHAQTRWFVAYERGGRGHHLVLVVFDSSGAAAKPVLLARGNAGRHDDVRGWQVDLGDLRRALKTGELSRDDPSDQYY